MKKDTLIKVCFVIGFVLPMIGAMLKILHVNNAAAFLIVGIISLVTYFLFAINEIVTSTRINRSEKIMWTIAFIFMSSIAGLIYFFIGHKRIVSKQVKR